MEYLETLVCAWPLSFNVSVWIGPIYISNC